MTKHKVNMTKTELAKKYFYEGYGCAQSVLLAFDSKTRLDPVSAINIAAPFNGGIGVANSLCGAVSGGLMVIGIIVGENHKNIAQKNTVIRIKSDEFLQKFKNVEETCSCEEILKKAEIRKENNHKACGNAVKNAVQILDQILN
ncbi:C_GCAxxG_C_C family protein [Salinivirga cyanobacteriivorans]|uniref:C_GCAxxG_C_C family protein n=2 Tax=Salinivirga cyanobacteriivorans TaxID=1307839 RepID=A0A0S2HWT9_9BACT|nr:C_GCAxxG_C_C family protein [Salinivirga cyanobacteriivorans]